MIHKDPQAAIGSRFDGWRCGCGKIKKAPGFVVDVKHLAVYEGTEHEFVVWSAVIKPDDESEKRYETSLSRIEGFKRN